MDHTVRIGDPKWIRRYFKVSAVNVTNGPALPNTSGDSQFTDESSAVTGIDYRVCVVSIERQAPRISRLIAKFYQLFDIGVMSPKRC